MYNSLLTEISRTRNLTTTLAQQAFLQSLQPQLETLRALFNNQRVVVDYRPQETQLAYILRYYPHYSQLLFQALSSLDEDLFKASIANRQVNAVLFGCGPCPEIYSLVKYIVQEELNVNAIQLLLVDQFASSWTYSSTIAFDSCVRPLIRDFDVNLIRHQCNLTALSFDAGWNTWANSSSLYIFQNCLNEFNQLQYPLLKQNIIRIANNMKPGSAIVIIDRQNYSAVDSFIGNFEGAINASNIAIIKRSWQEGGRRFDGYYERNRMPQIMKDYLFDGQDGRIATRNVDYNFSVIQKLPTGSRINLAELLDEPDDLPF